MAVLIKDPETERLVRELAQRTDATLTTAVKEAVRDKLAKLDRPSRKAPREEIDAFLAELWARPRINEHLTDDEILGYDEHGLPT